MNENNHLRGLHIVVINPSNGVVEWAETFDTYNTSERFDMFTDIELNEGFIVIAACKDECSKNMSEKGKIWFENMGS